MTLVDDNRLRILRCFLETMSWCVAEEWTDAAVAGEPLIPWNPSSLWIPCCFAIHTLAIVMVAVAYVDLIADDAFVKTLDAIDAQLDAIVDKRLVADIPALVLASAAASAAAAARNANIPLIPALALALVAWVPSAGLHTAHRDKDSNHLLKDLAEADNAVHTAIPQARHILHIPFPWA